MSPRKHLRPPVRKSDKSAGSRLRKMCSLTARTQPLRRWGGWRLQRIRGEYREPVPLEHVLRPPSAATPLASLTNSGRKKCEKPWLTFRSSSHVTNQWYQLPKDEISRGCLRQTSWIRSDARRHKVSGQKFPAAG